MLAEKTPGRGGHPEFGEITKLSEKLALRKALLEITNRIHAAQNIKEILVDQKDGILSLFSAYMITIYVVDRAKNEIYSYFLAGSQLKEIRLPINNSSIAGFVANTAKIANIADAYDKEELRGINNSLTFDESWDKKSGYRTTQVLAVPIFHENNLMGVVQIINKKGGGRFSPEEQSFLEEIAEVLGIAIYNQQKIVTRRRTRFDLLIALDLVTPQDLDRLWSEARKNNEPIENLLMSKNKIAKEDIGRSLEDFYRCKYVQFDGKFPIPEDLLKDLKRDYLRRELWVPLDKTDGKIRVVVDDPNNILKRDMIQNLLKTKSVEYCVALKEDIVKLINHFYQTQEGPSASISEILGKLEVSDEMDEEEESIVSESDSAIMQLVNKIINDAYNQRASDIHIEPNYAKKNVEVRYRVDGHCSLYQTVPYSYRAAIVSRIKIMSNLDITERRLPQDGKIKFKRAAGNEIELRVATLPTQGNLEDVVMRILAKGEIIGLEEMALASYNYKNMLNILKKPYGLVLCVGPTGSGKTTTLHAALHQINQPDKKIWTIEDPVEITQNGIRQVQVNPKIGLDFARAMRSFLRADPDVIMVGEMRDFETAKIGIEASLTGHLVLTTLHTNSAPETIVRLLDMGIDPLNFADSLLGILAQRLARTLCKNCKTQYRPSQQEYDELVDAYGHEHFTKLNLPYDDDFRLYRAAKGGCRECNNSGYRGRIAIHELLVATDVIKRLIQKRESVETIREAAIVEGMTTLLQDGIHKVLDGYTDFEQVRRVCIK